MKWHERHGQTIDLAMLLLVAVAIIGLFILPLIIPIRGHAGSCLVSDVPTQAVIGGNDGDTFGIYWFGPGVIRIRVKGVDTPERPARGTRSDGRWESASTFTRDWLMRGPFVVRTCFKRTLDRYEGIVERNGETLADALKAAGHSK